jgi:hypothetical protein
MHLKPFVFLKYFVFHDFKPTFSNSVIHMESRQTVIYVPRLHYWPLLLLARKSTSLYGSQCDPRAKDSINEQMLRWSYGQQVIEA